MRNANPFALSLSKGEHSGFQSIRASILRLCSGSARTGILLLSTFLFSVCIPLLSADEQRPVLILELKGIIDPAMARYVMRGLEEAREQQASAIVLQMETPGGLDRPVLRIVKVLLDSPVPVIVYVVPFGGKPVPAAAWIAGAAHVSGEGKDLEELLSQAEGRQVKTVFGTTMLDLQGRPRRFFPLSLMERILHRLAHPGLAYLLLLAGIYGLIYELATPGGIFPGLIGSLFLILALVALEMLEARWGGIGLAGLSLLFFRAEIKQARRGLLAAAGIALFLLGSAILFPGDRIPPLKLPGSLIGAAALLTVVFFRNLRRKERAG